MHYINRNIRWYRNFIRITQKEFADQLDTTLGRIKTYETDKAVPQIEMLIAITNIMGITLDALVHLELNEANYRAAKIERIKERDFFDDLKTINARLDKVEKAIKQKLKQKL